VSEPFSEENSPYEAPAMPSRRHRRSSRRDGLGGVFWAAMLIMAGMVFLADNVGVLPRYGGANIWDWLMLGAGGLLLVDALIRILLPDVSPPEPFWVIVGMVLLALGSSAIFSLRLTQWWPAILIFIGVASLARALRR